MPQISFKPYLKIGNKPDEKQDLLKVEMNTHPRNINSNMVFVYIPIVKTGSSKALLKLLVLLKKILKDQNLTTVPQMYSMMKNLLYV